MTNFLITWILMTIIYGMIFAKQDYETIMSVWNGMISVQNEEAKKKMKRIGLFFWFLINPILLIIRIVLFLRSVILYLLK
jgi:hypothetical protein